MEFAPPETLAQTATAQTIFAPASGAGRSPITILRLSGAATGDILAALAGPLPPARRASLRRLCWHGELLDQALVLWFPAPHSYTGQDCAELHLHGGRAVLAGVTAALRQAGARPAEPGEFTRRAVLGGQMDLLAAEAIADLVDAETSAQRQQALRQLHGGLGTLYAGWTERLRRALAWQEAVIDFADQDLPDDVAATAHAELVALHQEMGEHLADGRRGERLREGLVFVIVGAPNVGKSSLLNALAGDDIAIVSTIAGTTRDAVTARLECGGIPVELIDTAGLRDGADAVEAEGIRRARALADRADLVIGVIAPDAAAPIRACDLMVFNKTDLAPPPAGSLPAGTLGVSARSGAGIAALHARLVAHARALAAPGDLPTLTRARHRAAIEQGVHHLADAQHAPWADQRAEDLRLALACLGRITGAVSTEAVLDEVFATFCIGK